MFESLCDSQNPNGESWLKSWLGHALQKKPNETPQKNRSRSPSDDRKEAAPPIGTSTARIPHNLAAWLGQRTLEIGVSHSQEPRQMVFPCAWVLDDPSENKTA
jgi:hypothetical protein